MTRNRTRFNTRNRGEKSKKKVKLDWKLLRIEAIRLAYNASIKTIISKEERNQESQLSYEDFVAATMQAAEEHIEGNGRISKDWFTTSEGELNKAIKMRNYWYDIWATTSVAGARVKYKEARSELRKTIRKAKKKWHEDRAREIHDMNFNPKNAWCAIKEIRDGLEGHHKAQSDLKMRKADGELATNDSDNADVMGAHFTKVFNNHRAIDPTILDEIRQRTSKTELGNPPSLEEVKLALRKAANGKSPGESGITAEALKALDNELLQDCLLSFLTDYWNDPEVDYESWHRQGLCALRKAGKGKDYSDTNNWRGICLAEIPAKIQSSIISTRLLENLADLDIGIETQCGCVPGKGCADALFSMKSALQIRKQHGQDTWAIFVDLVKAFDTVDHALIFEILKKYGIPENMVRVIEKMYKDSTVIFKTGQETREIPYEIGVKQGDNMAPVLFIYLMNAFAETLSKKWTFDKLEYKWFPKTKNGNRNGRLTGQSPKAKGTLFDLFYFLYVDDGAMLFNNREDLEAGTTLLFSHFARFGLEMHIGRENKNSKTECMYFPAFNEKYQDENTENISVGDGFVSFTKEFKYLGSLITSELDDAVDVDARIAQANKAMGALRDYFKCKQVSLKAKRMIYLAIPINLVLWGVESWALTEVSMKKLSVFHTRSIRTILQINMTEVQEKRIRNEKILEMINLPTMDRLVAKRQLRWLGNVSRMTENRLPTKMLCCWNDNPRPSRRPHTTIRNSMIRSLKLIDPEISENATMKEWFPATQDRLLWAEQIDKLDPKSGLDLPFSHDSLPSFSTDFPSSPNLQNFSNFPFPNSGSLSSSPSFSNDLLPSLSPSYALGTPWHQTEPWQRQPEIEWYPSYPDDQFLLPPLLDSTPRYHLDDAEEVPRQFFFPQGPCEHIDEPCSRRTDLRRQPYTTGPSLLPRESQNDFASNSEHGDLPTFDEEVPGTHLSLDENTHPSAQDRGPSRYTRHRPPPVLLPENSEASRQGNLEQHTSSHPTNLYYEHVIIRSHL
jgi:hypothetical protein